MVLLMAYDFHEINRTSVNAPLFREETQNPYTESIAENIELIQKEGCKVDKMILGIPTYGRTYTLKDKNDDSIDAPIEKLGKMGPYTLSDGSLGFHEVSQVSSSSRETSLSSIEFSDLREAVGRRLEDQIPYKKCSQSGR